eukprot:8376216-Prorocentrum_lima.AAC.1
MTSSLVGSEMCIRDRTSSGPSSRSPSKPEWAPLKVTQVTLMVTPITLKAVSYTHLTLPTICSV